MARRRVRRGDPSKAVAVVRCSTDEQHLSPEAQVEAIRRWCDAEGVELLSVHTEQGVSGGADLDKRPGLLAALEAIHEAGAGLLVVARRDRLARAVIKAGMIEHLVERAGARVVSADGDNAEGPDGTLMRGVKDLFAQHEREVIRARTRAALAVKKARGERVGQVPFGFRLADDGVQLIEHEAEQATLQMIKDLRAKGKSLRVIVERLNEKRVPARGARWHATTVSRILNRAA